MQSSACAASRLFRAPGRVNLIGEHTDYNGGFVLPAAIGMAVTVAMSPREDQTIVARADTFLETIHFEINSIDHTPRGHWSDYVRGVALMLQNAGYRLRGADLIIHSDIPAGAGLSSSAAVEVATALALLARSGLEMNPRDLALLCQRAENEFVGVRSGIMDQMACCMGRSGHAILLDCRTLAVEYVPLPQQVRIVVCNSMVKHSLASGEYNRRREECERGVEQISQLLPNVRQLRDVTVAQLDQLRPELDSTIFRRCRHVVGENQRTLEAAGALRNGDLDVLGRLLIASHESLRDDYEVSCLELDILAETAIDQAGVYGSRMMGGGFGGCTISIVQEAHIDSFVREVTEQYARRTGLRCEIYICETADGAREVTVP